MQALTTRERLLQAGLALMLSKGYAATTVDEICAAAGVSKGSFYHAFPSKEDLGLAILDDYFQRQMTAYGDGPHRRIADPRERAFAFLDHVERTASGVWSSGCLLGVFALDMAESSPKIQARLADLFDRMSASLARLFEPLLPAGKRKSQPTADELASHFIAMVEGSIVLAKAHQDGSRIVSGIRSFRRYLECVIR
ncbi:MAG TPA: TetR/AcrR family transcriptional regulator [Pelomicrobium sp.]|nr:TetR/AcrR family transcriptional regulator [Pelomicrobium sp.]